MWSASTLSWKTVLADTRCKRVWQAIILMRRLFAVPDSNPLGLTLFVQAANGLVLAVIALFLIYDVYQSSLMAKQRNCLLANSCDALVVLSVTALEGYRFVSLL